VEAIAWVLGVGIAVYLLFRFPKKMLILLGVLAVVAAGVGAWLYVVDNRPRWEREAISLTVTYDPETCSADWPLRIEYQNNARRTLIDSAFAVEGFRDAYSNPLYQSPPSYYSTDRIIEPGEPYLWCYSIPPVSAQNSGIEDLLEVAHPPETLEWRARITSARFRD